MEMLIFLTFLDYDLGMSYLISKLLDKKSTDVEEARVESNSENCVNPVEQILTFAQAKPLNDRCNH